MPPLPKRNAERRRRHKDSRADTVSVKGRVPVPALPETTHPIARRWYLSLKKSGQSRFYEPSDWAQALLVCEALTLALAASALAARHGDYEKLPIRPAQLAVILQGMDRLLTTEWARRHARLEIERQTEPPEELPGVAALLAFRQRAEREQAQGEQA